MVASSDWDAGHRRRARPGRGVLSQARAFGLVRQSAIWWAPRKPHMVLAHTRESGLSFASPRAGATHLRCCNIQWRTRHAPFSLQGTLRRELACLQRHDCPVLTPQRTPFSLFCNRCSITHNGSASAVGTGPCFGRVGAGSLPGRPRPHCLRPSRRRWSTRNTPQATACWVSGVRHERAPRDGPIIPFVAPVIDRSIEIDRCHQIPHSHLI